MCGSQFRDAKPIDMMLVMILAYLNPLNWKYGIFHETFPALVLQIYMHSIPMAVVSVPDWCFAAGLLMSHTSLSLSLFDVVYYLEQFSKTD